MKGRGGTILQRILARKAEELAWRREQRPEIALRKALARGEAPPVRDFHWALCQERATDPPAVIAELKRASPSAGVIREDFDPAWIGARYAKGGAAALSVLTDAEFFGGADAFLTQARYASGLPTLRKDFIIDPYQVSEARLIGADCVLLIVAALDDFALAACLDRAREMGMAALVEVHDREELDRALASGAELIGINNRDLHTFEIRLETSIELAAQAPEGVSLVGESGIHSRTDMDRLREAGLSAFLVGGALMQSPDPGEALAALLSP